MAHELPPPYSLDNALDFIASTETGRDLVSKARALMKAGKLRVELLTGELREQIGSEPKFAADYYNFGKEKVISIDYKTPQLGQLASVLVHELTHVLDEDVPTKEQDLLAWEVRDGMVRPELKAYTADHQFKQELANKYPCYGRYWKSASDYLMLKVPTESWIRQNYEPLIEGSTSTAIQTKEVPSEIAASSESAGE